MYKITKQMMAYTPDVQMSNSHIGTHYIYVIKNPADDSVFYVGKTSKDLKVRMSGHLSDSGDGSPKGEIIKSILSVGAIPVIESIETIYATCYIDTVKVSNREIYWIKHYRNIVTLTNKALMQEDPLCREYETYKKNVADGQLYLHYYLCGHNRYGLPVYDIERASDDGFDIDFSVPEDSRIIAYQSTPVWGYNTTAFDDENPDYIRGSIEEM